MEKLKIDTKRLHDELVSLRNYYSRSPRKDDLKNDYNAFKDLVSVYENLTGEEFKTDGLFPNKKKVEDMLDKSAIKMGSEMFKNIEDYFDFTYKTFCNFYNKNIQNILDVPYFAAMRRYNEKEFKDIILDYYSKYGNHEYELAHKYFDEGRIQIGYPLWDAEGYHYSTIFGNIGYIVLSLNLLNSYCQNILVHELGHAIDNSIVLSPLRKKIDYSDCLLEVPSSFFELGFTKFLKDNKIDVDGANIMFQDTFVGLRNSAISIDALNDEVQKGYDILIDEEGESTLSDGEVVQTHKIFTYGISYYIALYLQCILDGNYKEFMKDFYGFLANRDKLTLEESINMLGINRDDFIKGSVIKPLVKESNRELKRRFNL